MDFQAQVVVGRKIEGIFKQKYHSSEERFYDDLVAKLFENVLHTSTENIIYFSKRGSRARQEPLAHAINEGIRAFEKKWSTRVQTNVFVYPQKLSGEPCLQVADYVTWAVQRAFIKREMRYFNFLRSKIRLVVDVFDAEKYPRNYYTEKNPFDVEKISPL